MSALALALAHPDTPSPTPSPAAAPRTAPLSAARCPFHHSVDLCGQESQISDTVADELSDGDGVSDPVEWNSLSDPVE